MDSKESSRWKQTDWSGNLPTAKFFQREVWPTSRECEWARQWGEGERETESEGEETWWTDVFGWGPHWRGRLSCDHNWTTFSLPRSPYNNVHFLFFLLTGGGHSTARMASSNTVLRPRCVRAEHSRYFTAPAGRQHRLLVNFFAPYIGIKHKKKPFCSSFSQNNSTISEMFFCYLWAFPINAHEPELF